MVFAEFALDPFLESLALAFLTNWPKSAAANFLIEPTSCNLCML